MGYKKEITENVNETYLMSRIQEIGGLAVKLECPGTRGFPDRMIILPYGIISYAEIKRPKEKPRPNQTQTMMTLASYGVDVWWANTKEEIDKQVWRLKQSVELARLQGRAKATVVQGPATPIRQPAVFHINTAV